MTNWTDCLLGPTHPTLLHTFLQVESKCLEGLGWRLGPYFLHDELDGLDDGCEARSPQ